MVNKKALWVIIGLIALIGLIIAVPYAAHGILTKEAIKIAVESYGALAPVAFIIFYIIAVLLLVPATLFSIAGGFIFGKVYGTIYVVIAATIAAIMGFLLARR